MLPDTHADHQGASRPCHHQPVGRGTVDHRDGVGAAQAREASPHRREQVGAVIEGMVDQVGDQLGIGVRFDRIAARQQLGAQLGMIFDNAVVHHRHAVGGDMGMRVALARRAVGGPAGVSQTQRPLQRMGFQRLGQHLDLAHGAHPLEALSAQNHHTSRVIATVFQTPQALQQDGRYIALRDGADDATHGFSSFPEREWGAPIPEVRLRSSPAPVAGFPTVRDKSVPARDGWRQAPDRPAA